MCHSCHHGQVPRACPRSPDSCPTTRVSQSPPQALAGFCSRVDLHRQGGGKGEKNPPGGAPGCLQSHQRVMPARDPRGLTRGWGWVELGEFPSHSHSHSHFHSHPHFPHKVGNRRYDKMNLSLDYPKMASISEGAERVGVKAARRGKALPHSRDGNIGNHLRIEQIQPQSFPSPG